MDGLFAFEIELKPEDGTESVFFSDDGMSDSYLRKFLESLNPKEKVLVFCRYLLESGKIIEIRKETSVEDTLLFKTWIDGGAYHGLQKTGIVEKMFKEREEKDNSGETEEM
jgi:hypothetical protein